MAIKTCKAPQINEKQDFINCMPAFLTHDMCWSAFATFLTSISSSFAKLLISSSNFVYDGNFFEIWISKSLKG